MSFQESILSIATSAVFLAVAGPRAYYLFKTPDKAKRHATYTPKLVSHIPLGFFAFTDVG